MPSLAFARVRAALCCLGALLLLSACAVPAAPKGERMPVSFLPAPGDFLDAAGDRIGSAEFGRRAAKADYVLIGESHASPCDHEAERRIVALLARDGRPPAVGLEMVPGDRSRVLADFVAGKIDAADLPARLDWARTWGFPFRFYLPVFEAVRQAKLPAAGLNVPPGVIRRLSAAAMNAATAADPVAALSPEDRKLLPARIVPPAPEQLEFLRQVMQQHFRRDGDAPEASNPLEMKRFELIQSVWDSAMAEQAVRLRKATGRPVAVLAGTAHVDGGLGIARRLHVYDPGASVLLVSPWRGDELNPKDADLRVYCPASFESRMGMTLERRPDGMPGGDGHELAWDVVVSAVRRGSRADKAGLRPGDILLAVGGHPMEGLMTLHFAGSEAYREKKRLVFRVQRGPACYDVDLGPLGGGR